MSYLNKGMEGHVTYTYHPLSHTQFPQVKVPFPVQWELDFSCNEITSFIKGMLLGVVLLCYREQNERNSIPFIQKTEYYSQKNMNTVYSVCS